MIAPEKRLIEGNNQNLTMMAEPKWCYYKRTSSSSSTCSQKFRTILNGFSFLMFLLLVYNHSKSRNHPPNSLIAYSWGFRANQRTIQLLTIGNKIVGLGDNSTSATNSPVKDPKFCDGLWEHTGYGTCCDYLHQHPACTAGGFFNYIHFFYCDCHNFPIIGYIMLAIWLAALFYLLGNTAADYFCSSLEKFSSALKLPPTVAGVTLLPLGNGAPDVFASIAAFVGMGTGQVGLNSILGGAVFVTCIVVGTISLCIMEKGIQIDKKCFIRDLSFFLVTVLSLGVILIVGSINLIGAMAFVFIYILYAFVVAANELLRKQAQRLKLDALGNLLPENGSLFPHEIKVPSHDHHHQSLAVSLMDPPSDDIGSNTKNGDLPHWLWASNVAIYSNEGLMPAMRNNNESLWGWNDHEGANCDNIVHEILDDDQDDPHGVPSCSHSQLLGCFHLLETPLTLARRLTIPVVDEERWSKDWAVISVTMAPILLAFLWNNRDQNEVMSPFNEKGISLVIGMVSGGLLGILAYLNTKPDGPPEKLLFAWLFGGFFMSVVWFYLVANELVALIVALAVIVGINPSMLGVTVLAWGNSMGDLTGNVALALNGGDSAQIAMSGCYAGPMFNTLAGLGVSMLVGASSARPEPYIFEQDDQSLIYTIGFMVLGLIWSLVVLPWNDMRPNKILGVGLIVIYFSFLVFRVSTSLYDFRIIG